MKRLKPYSNWTRTELAKTLITHINRLEIDKELKVLWIDLVNEAFDSKDWNVLEDYNGCTVVQDFFHPCPACFVHDYMGITGRGGRVSDRIFYHLMIAEGMPNGKSKRRWFAVRVAWYGYFLWKHIVRRSLKPTTRAMIALDKYLTKTK